MQLERRLSRLNKICRILGWYQIIGGIAGFGMLAWACTSVNGWHTSLMLLLLFIGLLYGFSVCCGALLLKSPLKGLSWSFVNQLVQTVHFGLLGYVFKFIAGISISVKWMPVLSFHFGLEPSSFTVQFNTDEMHAFIGINLVAVFLAYYTIHLKDAYTEAILAKEITDIADIGHN